MPSRVLEQHIGDIEPLSHPSLDVLLWSARKISRPGNMAHLGTLDLRNNTVPRAGCLAKILTPQPEVGLAAHESFTKGDKA